MTLIRAAKREAEFIKTTHVISREALELLSDEDLVKFGVKRVTEHNYKAAGASVDLGKSVNAAEKSAKAAAKTAKKVTEAAS